MSSGTLPNLTKATGSFRKINLLCFLLIITSFAVKGQQDPQFSQNQFNLLTINPGFAGSSERINLSLLNRYQWVGFPGAPVTLVFNAEGSTGLIGRNDGIGLSVMSDAIGFEKNTSVVLSYSWRVKLANGYLGSGLSIGAVNKNLNLTSNDGSSLVNGSDVSLPQKAVNEVLADMGIGFYFENNNFHLSLSSTHINQPTLSIGQAGKYSYIRHFYVQAGKKFRTGDEKIILHPSFLVKAVSKAWQADLNCMAMYDDRIWAALGYRLKDAIVIQIGSELWNGLRLGYSYDITTSSISRYSGGSHEIFLAYSLLTTKKKVRPYKSVRFL